MKHLVAAILLASYSSGCEIASCDEGAESLGGICVPEGLGSGVPPAECGNMVCERRATPAEDRATCPADCDPGYPTRASFMRTLIGLYYNDHVAGITWPAGQVDANGACEDGGSAAAQGTIAKQGSTNVYQLRLDMSTCTIDFGSLGSLRSTGSSIMAATQFNNDTVTENTHVSGAATISGSDGRTPYDARLCDFDFTFVRTGTTSFTTGDFCGKPLRTIISDDQG